ncbi:MAG: thiopeptide-type bacteriocin biosynthesis protein, partial [Myxococcota bacterium]
VFAEIVHLPAARLGNILYRPVLRDWEIPYLGRSGAPAARQLPISDLVVAVEGGRVVLRSRRLGRQVIPRLTSAHAYGHGLSLYNFLCAVQDQGAPVILWDWGPAAYRRFLPRVSHGRAIFARARWLLSRTDLAAVAAAARAQPDESTPAHIARIAIAVARLRRDRDLPRYIALVDGDNELPIDLDNPLSADSFADAVKSRDQAVVREWLPGPDQQCVTGPTGRFAHELVIALVREPADSASASDAASVSASDAASDAASDSDSAAPPIRRRFPPGSPWLHSNLYCSPAIADRVLLETIDPLVRDLDDPLSWFFIRYDDPEWHLRVRFHGPPAALREQIEPALCRALEPLLDDGLVWRVQFDTYEREVERYGGAAGIELCEAIFCADSAAALAILAALSSDDDSDSADDLRWRLAVVGVDALLGDLGLDRPARLAWAERVREDFAREFAVDTAFRKQLGQRYRTERPSLEALLSGQPSGQPAAALAA